jgi:hypothetical protein
MGTSGNQTMNPEAVSNPNLGFALEYASDWQKEENEIKCA